MRRFGLILFIAVSQFTGTIMHSMVGVTLPAMGHELGASGVELGLVDTVFVGVSAAFLVPIGRLADATDRTILFKYAMLALVALTAAIGLQQSMSMVIGVRLLQGIAAAVVTATGIAIVADIAPPGQTGRMIGLAMGATYAGLASGPYFAGLIATHLDWRFVFLAGAVLPLASWALAQANLTGSWRAPRTSINIANSVLLAAAVGTLMLGVAWFGRAGYGAGLMAAGLVLGGVFVLVEIRSANPLLKLAEIAANRRLGRALCLQLLIYCGTVGTSFLLSLYLQVIQGRSPEAAGGLLIISPIVMAIPAPAAGRLSDKVRPDIPVAAGTTLILCSVVMGALLRADSGNALVIALLIAQGLGFALFSGPNIAIVMAAAPTGERGLASALTAEMRSIGMMVSMSFATVILSVRLGTAAVADRPEAYMSAMTTAFTVFSVLTALGVLVSLQRSGDSVENIPR